MFINLFLALLTSFFISTESFAAGMSATDFLPPAGINDAAEKKSASEVKNPDAVHTEKGIDGKNAVGAANAQDAANAAFSRITDGGWEQIKFPSGFGWVATGVDIYGVSKNPVANLLAQRNAYQIALLNAKKNLAQALNGLSTSGRDELNQQFQTVISADDTLTNMNESFGDNISETVDGMLRGYLLYDARDDQDGEQGKVTVSIVVTPKTLGMGSRAGANALNSESIQEGLQSVLNELSSGLLSPVGGKFINVPQTGELAFVGFGSAVIPDNPNQAVHAKLILNAEKMAQMRARSALCGIILGDKITALSSLDANTATISKQFEENQKNDIDTGDDGKGIQKLDQQRNQFLSQQFTTEQISSLREGILPPGIKMQTYLNADKTLAEAVAVYIPGLSAETSKTARQMRENSPMRQGELPPQGPSGQVMRDADL